MAELSISFDTLDTAIRKAIAAPPHVPKQTGISTLQSLADNLGVSFAPPSDKLRSRYVLGSEIGRGGVGVVWSAQDLDLNRDVAVKVLRTEYEISPMAVRRFVQEAQVAGRLQHPGIVPVYELGTFPDGRIYLVMKLVNGTTLASLLAKRSHTQEQQAQLLNVFQSVAETMAYAHSQNIVHLDLKPANIMVGQFNDIHVMDWGFAKILGKGIDTLPGSESEGFQTGFGARTSQVGHSRAGLVMGTPGYMAPEQTEFGSQQLDKRCDVFSLGVILLDIVGGQPLLERHPLLPDDAIRPDEIMEHVRRRLQDQAIEEPLKQLIRDCLHPDPDQRPADAGEIAAEMAKYHLGIRERLTEAVVGRRTVELRVAEERYRRKLWIALLMTGGVAIAGVSVLLFIHHLENATRVAKQSQTTADAEREVTRTLDEADQLLVSGRREKAEAAVRLAEGLAKSSTETVQQRVADRLADVRMLEQLESIRMKRATGPPIDVPWSDYQPDRWGSLHDRSAPLYYARAFRQYGLDVEQLPPEQVVQRLRNRTIRAALVRGLDEWATNTLNDRTQAKLRSIAAEVEDQPESLSNRIRVALGTADPSELIRISSQIQPNESPQVHFMAGRALRKRGTLNEAVRSLTAAVARYPGDFWLNLELGTVHALASPKDRNLSRPWITTAFALSDGNADVYVYLAIAQSEIGLLEDAEASLRHALQITPNMQGGRLRLATLLNLQKKYTEARQIVDEAVAAESSNPIVHFERGLVFQLQPNPNILPIAIESYRKAVELNPDFAEAWNNLGNTLTTAKRYDDAVTALNKALAVRPDYARAMYNLGVLYDQQSRTTDAVAVYTNAIEIQPNMTEASFNLAYDLMHYLGKFTEAIVILERGLLLIPRTDNERWQRVLSECKRLQKLETLQVDLEKSNRQPQTPLETADLAVFVAMPHRQQFALATRYWEKVFQSNPAMANDLIQGYRYFAAGCAVRAGCGQGRDSLFASDMERSRLRALALTWLQTDLALRKRQLQSDNPKQTAVAKSALRYWKGDSNLTEVRDPTALTSLTDTERAGWHELWSTLDRLAQ